MQKLSFPPIRSGLQISMAPKEPPSRSWSKYKKVLIDNPKDSNLLHRQKLWNFQKLNRGAFRSQIASLPDIPYRHTNPVEKVSVGTQVDFSHRFTRSLRVIFPNLTTKRGSVNNRNDESVSDQTDQDKACSPMQEVENDSDNYSDDFEEDVIDQVVNDLDVDNIIRTQNAGTMTEESITSDKKLKSRYRKRKSMPDKNPYKEKNPILSSSYNSSLPPINKKKQVKFESEDDQPETKQVEKDKPEMTPEPEIEAETETIPTLPIVNIKELDRESTDDVIPFPVENIGHSSHLALDTVSILDFISGGLSDRSRNSDRLRSRDSNNLNSKRRAKGYSDPDADRVWFEKLVGDKELIDSENYESFARIRPNNEQQYQSDQEKIADSTKLTPRKNFTPRINDEFPSYHSVLSKSSTIKNVNLLNGPTVMANKGKTQRRPPVNIGKIY